MLGKIGKSIIAIKYSFNPNGRYKTLIIIASLKVSSGFNWISSLVNGIL